MRFFIRCAAVVFCLLLPVTGECALMLDGGYTPQVGQEGKDILWVPTAHEHVDIMLDLAKVTPADYVIDLGSGDGRLVIAAAKRGATALGIEYDPQLVTFSRQLAAKEGVNAKASFKTGDLFESDFSKATVLTLFLLQEINVKLRPKILDMAPGTRVVTNSFDMAEWVPDQTVRSELVHPESKKVGHFFTYLWIVPAKVDGTWKTDNGQISFVQKFQNVTGKLTVKGKDTELIGKLTGATLTFTAGDMKYTGTVNRNTISGTRADGKSWKAAR